jgi:hypothetical protein
LHRTINESIVKALHGKPHLNDKYWGMAYNDCIFKLNLMPVASQGGQCPYNKWESKPFNLDATLLLPFGTIVMAHIPVSQQHALGGKSIETFSVGCVPGCKGGILLMNPHTKRTIVRRSFKAFGTTAPVSPVYKVTVAYDTLDFQPADIVADASSSPDPPPPISTRSTDIPTVPNLVHATVNPFSALNDDNDDVAVPVVPSVSATIPLATSAV